MRYAILEWNINDRCWDIINESNMENAKRKMRMYYKISCARYPNKSFKFVEMSERVIESRVVNRDAEFRDLQTVVK